MSSEPSRPRRRYYGIAEIADAVGVDRQLVTMWRRRSSHGMPDPDEELSSGPVWDGIRIEPWINATRTRLYHERTVKAGDVLTPELGRQVARRIFRLMAVLLEERVHPPAIERALHDLAQLQTPLARVSNAPEGSKKSLHDVVTLCAVAEQALASGRSMDSLRTEMVAAYLPGVTQVARLITRFE